MGGVTLLVGDVGLYKRTVWVNCGGRASKQHSSMASTLVPVLTSLS